MYEDYQTGSTKLGFELRIAKLRVAGLTDSTIEPIC